MPRHALPPRRWVRPARRLAILAGVVVLVIVVAHLIPAAPRPSIGPAVSTSPTAQGSRPGPGGTDSAASG